MLGSRWLAVRSGPHFIHRRWHQIDKDYVWNMLSCTHMREVVRLLRFTGDWQYEGCRAQVTTSVKHRWSCWVSLNTDSQQMTKVLQESCARGRRSCVVQMVVPRLSRNGPDAASEPWSEAFCEVCGLANTIHAQLLPRQKRANANNVGTLIAILLRTFCQGFA